MKMTWRHLFPLACLLVCSSLPVIQGAPGRHNYTDALSKSLLFYLAQRSGHLPDHDVPWRGDSAMADGSDINRDLTGGWYDAGDFLKLNFPMAASTTNLLWGLLKFHDAYSTSSQLALMQKVVKWPLDYFLKCWDADQNILYGQVGKVDLDHDFWGRPEEMTMARPAYKLTTVHPGSDLSAETAAALTAGYIAFKSTDAAYANTLLSAARSLYDFADSHHGLYHHAIHDAADAYPSYGFQDELCWGAAWLYKATGEAAYQHKALRALEISGVDSNEFSWDDKAIGCVLLLHEAEPEGSIKKEQYAGYVTSFLHQWRTGSGGITRTPCGLSFLSKWGSLRYALNAALIALVAADQGIEPQANRAWALSQANYALGDNKYGRSYVVGYGVNPPVRPHHAASSCRDPPTPCDWDDFTKAAPNGHVLYGALIGGPDKHDNYHDNRTDYIMNEVTCDYNAGFQSVLAGLISLQHSGQLPNSSPACTQQNADVTTHMTHHVTQTTSASATQGNEGADLDCRMFGSHRYQATATGYFPARSQGGVMDMNDHHLQTLQDFLEEKSSYVSVAMDNHAAGISYGTAVCIPELNHKYNRVILFKVVDSASDLHGFSMINICARDRHASHDNAINGPVTLVLH